MIYQLKQVPMGENSFFLLEGILENLQFDEIFPMMLEQDCQMMTTNLLSRKKIKISQIILELVISYLFETR